jgi:hypothetical protein
MMRVDFNKFKVQLEMVTIEYSQPLIQVKDMFVLI